MDYHIVKISRNKKQYLDLLLLGDEQEIMIDRYLERGDLFVLEDNGIKAVCVVTKEGPKICELKNIAVTPSAQRQGYGRKLINYLINHYSKENMETNAKIISDISAAVYRYAGNR